MIFINREYTDCAMTSSTSTSLTTSSSTGKCCTKIKVTKYNFSWTIENYSFSQNQTGQFLQSSIFSTADCGNSKWCLILYPNGDNLANSNFVSLYLRLITSKKTEVVTRFSLALLNYNRETTNVVTFDHIYRAKYEDYGSERFFPKFKSSQEVKDWSNEDKLIFSSEISIVDKEYLIVETDTPILIPPSCLSEQLETLYESQEFSDVVLFSKGKEFHCHKTILAARSPIFLAMFKHNMEEREKNRVVISDIDEKDLEELLRFIYTSKAPDIEKLTKELLIAANKYNIQRLKVMCEDALSRTLSVEAAVELLKFSDKYNADMLKCRTIQFIVNNAVSVMSTKEWENLIQENPDLIIDVSRCLDIGETSTSFS